MEAALSMFQLNPAALFIVMKPDVRPANLDRRAKVQFQKYFYLLRYLAACSDWDFLFYFLRLI